MTRWSRGTGSPPGTSYLRALERAPRQRNRPAAGRPGPGRGRPGRGGAVDAGVGASGGGRRGAGGRAAGRGGRPRRRAGHLRAGRGLRAPRGAGGAVPGRRRRRRPIPGERASLLGSAVVRAPPRCGWPGGAGLEALLALGDARGALAEAEHLEASVLGAAARVEVLLQGRALARGMASQAIAIFERALRARPATRACWGWPRPCVHVGEPARAADVLARAVALAEAKRQPDTRATVLARVLAEGLNELPLAIARARAVPRAARRAANSAPSRPARYRCSATTPAPRWPTPRYEKPSSMAAPPTSSRLPAGSSRPLASRKRHAAASPPPSATWVSPSASDPATPRC